MSSVVISGDTSGAITLAAPAVSGTNTATLPAATGTVMVSGNMPAFSAYQSSNQSISNGVNTKILFQTEEFDTNNNFASSRFTPTIAGYYQINSTINIQGSGGNNFIIMIWKNGSEFKRGNQVGVNSAGNNGVVISALIYFNGSTDYIEIYGYQSAGGANLTEPGATLTWVQGCLVRNA